MISGAATVEGIEADLRKRSRPQTSTQSPYLGPESPSATSGPRRRPACARGTINSRVRHRAQACRAVAANLSAPEHRPDAVLNERERHEHHEARHAKGVVRLATGRRRNLMRLKWSAPTGALGLGAQGARAHATLYENAKLSFDVLARVRAAPRHSASAPILGGAGFC